MYDAYEDKIPNPIHSEKEQCNVSIEGRKSGKVLRLCYIKSIISIKIAPFNNYGKLIIYVEILKGNEDEEPRGSLMEREFLEFVDVDKQKTFWEYLKVGNRRFFDSISQSSIGLKALCQIIISNLYFRCRNLFLDCCRILHTL